jgi:tripartite-type tricarboxylate transporter receptor subunit TctC
MEPMADLFPEYKYNDIQTFTYLDSANMSQSDVAKLRAAWQNVLKSENVAGHITKKKLFHPSVYGQLSPTEWAAKLDKAGKNWVGK